MIPRTIFTALVALGNYSSLLGLGVGETLATLAAVVTAYCLWTFTGPCAD